MAQSILMGGPADTDPPQGMAQTPLGPGDSSDSPSDSRTGGAPIDDRARKDASDGLLQPADEPALPEVETAEPVGRQEAARIAETPSAFDDA